MNERIPVDRLTQGMFVAELDRPWIDAPFPLQGFIIESQEQIELLQQFCRFVHVDRQQSVGDAHRDQEADVKERDSGVAPRGPTPSGTQSASLDRRKSAGLLASLKEIWTAAFGPDFPGSPRKALQVSGTEDPRGRETSGIQMRYVDLHAVRRQGFTEMEEEYLLGKRPPPEDNPPAETLVLPSWLGNLFRWKKKKTPSPAPAAASRSEDGSSVYPDQQTFENELSKAAAAHQRCEEAIATIVRDISENKPLPLETAEEAVAWMVESILRNPDSLSWLARLKTHNHHTYDHALNVAVYLLNFGRHLGLPKVMLQLLGIAGLLQDVGKVIVPSEVLDKRSPLTAEECELLKAHVNHTIQILGDLPRVSPMLLDTVAQHHERYDGSGYPYGLKGDQIGLFGAMAGIADAFVAMTSPRPYGEPLSPEKALQQLYLWRDEAFSAEIVQEFIKCVGVFPVGTLVELNSGEAAVVVAHNRENRRFPRLMLILDPAKKPYAKPMMLDLMFRPLAPGGEPYRIVRGLHGEPPSIDLSALRFGELTAA